jgi:hypothetical protein
MTRVKVNWCPEIAGLAPGLTNFWNSRRGAVVYLAACCEVCPPVYEGLVYPENQPAPGAPPELH